MELRVFSVGGFTPIPQILDQWFTEVNERISGRDYGGPMEHLWIEVEVYEYGMNVPERAPWPFRFQKRVAPRIPTGLEPLGKRKEYANVGHYSVRPTAADMHAESDEQAARQVVKVVVESTACLEKRRQIRGFDAARFEEDFANAFRQFVTLPA